MRVGLLAVFLAVCALGVAAQAPVGPSPGAVVLSPDGWFRLSNGELFIPLGGFHGNMVPLARINLTPAERSKITVWTGGGDEVGLHLIDGQGHVEFSELSSEVLDAWFKQLAANGVTAIRLFPGAKVAGTYRQLDRCGQLDPDVKQSFHRLFAAAQPYGIRFLLQILSAPGGWYAGPKSGPGPVLPQYSLEELAKLSPAQKRFCVEGRRLERAEFFSDPDVLACQKQYLQQALDWVATEPQVFALEIYNEQGWTQVPLNGKADEYTYTFPYEDAEIRWSTEIVRAIKQRLPNMLVTLSHPGFGITGYDPLKWCMPTGVDFYSPHLYAGLGGDNDSIDFAISTAASALIISAGIPNFYGEWGLFASLVPQELKRFSHRDAIWLTLLGGQPGFLQWTYEFPEEYRWPATIFRSLPKNFSPARPKLEVEIGEAYSAFQDNTRYSKFVPGQLFPAFPMNRQKQKDENLQKIFQAYVRSLDYGVPIAFTIGQPKALSLADFAALDLAKLPHPIQAVGGYQLTYLKDANNPVWIAYLRNRKMQTFGEHHVGVPEQAPLELKFDLPKGSYHVRIINLNANREESRSLKAKDTLKLSEKTSDDYVLVVTQ